MLKIKPILRTSTFKIVFIFLWALGGLLLPKAGFAEQTVPVHDLKCNAAFPCPQALHRRVDFWIEVFSKWEKDTAILHDYNSPWRVYKTLEGIKSCNGKLGKREKQRLRANLKALAKRLKNQQAPKGRVQKHLAKQFDHLSAGSVRKSVKNIRCQFGVKNQFTAALSRFERYKEIISKIIAEQDMPADLLYLPFVESSYRANAYSKVGAAGMWQIMPNTARDLGMELSAVLDERLDPEAATRGAMRYFKNAQKKLIPLAKSLSPHISEGEINPFIVTSYNYGINGMRRAMKQIGLDFMQVLNQYKSAAFQVAVKNFYASFLAARHLAQNAQVYFGEINAQSALRYQTFVLPTASSIARIKHQFGLSEDRLKPLNPALTRFAWNDWRLIPAGYRLHLPYKNHRWQAQIDALNALPAEAQPLNKQVYRVRRGDTACGIANAFQVSCRALIKSNRLGRKAVLKIGQKLDIHGNGTIRKRGQTKKNKVASAVRKQKSRTYKVKKGDTACGIAQRFDASCREVIRLNKLGRKAVVKLGQRLRIPGTATNQVAEPSVLNYKVKRGDTACGIAQRYVLPCSRLLSDNKLGKKGVIKVGQILHLRGRSEKSSNNVSISRYTVQSGDTACAIAERFDVSCGNLLRTNHLGKKGRIKVGQQLKITSTIGGNARNVVDEQQQGWLDQIDALPNLKLRSNSSGVVTKVLPNETMAHYADWMGVSSTKSIRALNGMQSDAELKLGQGINLPITRAKTNKRFRQKRNEFHQVLAEQFKERFKVVKLNTRSVKSGQSLWTIANKNEVPLWLLLRFNPSLNAQLKLGQKIKIPIIEENKG